MANINQPYSIPNGLAVSGGVLDVLTTSHIRLPTGTTAQRLPNAPDFSIRGNEQTGLLEYKRNGRWHSISSGEAGDEALLLTLILG